MGSTSQPSSPRKTSARSTISGSQSGLLLPGVEASIPQDAFPDSEPKRDQIVVNAATMPSAPLRRVTSVPNTMSGDSDVRPARSHAAAPTTLTNLTEEDAGAEVDVPRRPIFVRQLTLHEQQVHRHDSTSDEAPAERWNYSINDDRGDDPDMEDVDDDLVVLRHLSARGSSQA